MAPLFTSFWKQTRVVGKNIDRFFLHVRRTHSLAIHIMSGTEQRLQEIEKLEEQDRTQNFLGRAMSLIRPEPPSPFVLALEAYLGHLDGLKGTVEKLIADNKLVLDSMEDLEDMLFVMGDFTTEDKYKIRHSQMDLKTGILNKILPNTRALRKIESSLAVLDEVNPVREYGVALFAASLVRLRGLSAELDDLRERIVMKEVGVGEDEGIASIESQLLMVGKGLARMRDSQARAEQRKQKYRDELHEQLHKG